MNHGRWEGKNWTAAKLHKRGEKVILFVEQVCVPYDRDGLYLNSWKCQVVRVSIRKSLGLHDRASGRSRSDSLSVLWSQA